MFYRRISDIVIYQRNNKEETLHLLASQLKEKFSENGTVNSKADHE
jgi:translation initiation factor 1 (eIF-1/SUI1)